MTQKIAELIERWNSGEGKPYKGSLIDWSAYEANPESIQCFCAQGQVLHVVDGWTPERLRNTEQQEADKRVAELLNISRAHAILLRNVNDKIDGAPSIVLTDPGKVLGGEWSKLLDFWWHMDRMTPEQWAAARAAWAAVGVAAWAAAWAAARDAAWAAAWAAAWDAAGAAAWAAARDAAWAAAQAAWAAAGEIQGAHIFKAADRQFHFLPLFGFADPDAIPARPADYGATPTP